MCTSWKGLYVSLSCLSLLSLSLVSLSCLSLLSLSLVSLSCLSLSSLSLFSLSLHFSFLSLSSLHFSSLLFSLFFLRLYFPILSADLFFSFAGRAQISPFFFFFYADGIERSIFRIHLFFLFCGDERGDLVSRDSFFLLFAYV
jgi:hypothetical protein